MYHYYLMGYHIILLLRNDMETIKGCTKENADGSYTICINARMGFDEQRKTLEHELRHIGNKDFEREESATRIECLAHIS